jgi:L-asparaginase
MRRILILYTGGTIGMKTDPGTGVLSPFQFDQIEEEVPELKKFNLDLRTVAFDPPIDSSNVTPEIWRKMARVIAEHYDTCDGFVVLHGTDTMSYSASALSFMMQNLAKPVIFTGSQIPIGVIRTDGKENLITAIEIAAARENGRPVVPEVCVYFQDRLFRGNRTRKRNAEQFDAFASDNYPPLAEAGINITYNYHNIRKAYDLSPPFGISEELDTRVSVIRIFPGMDPEVFRAVLNIAGLRAVVLETYGSGNAPTARWFIRTLEEAIDGGLIVLNVSQCPAGRVEMERYETGLELQRIGVIGGKDITTEAALAKLMVLLGQNRSPEETLKALNRSIRGEITE